MIHLALLFTLSGPPLSALAQSTGPASVRDPCTTSERWMFSDSQKKSQWTADFERSIAADAPFLSGLAGSIRLSRISALLKNSGFERDFAEYWAGRSLFRMGLLPVARSAFLSLLEHTRDRTLRRASQVCLARIESEFPDLKNPDLKAPEPAPREILAWSPDELATLIPFLMQSESPLSSVLPEPHRSLVSGFKELKNRRYSGAIPLLSSVLRSIELHPGSPLARYRDELHLALGRALYSVARFRESAAEFQKVSKTSNRAIEALSNLSWAYLLDRRPDDALGVGIQIRSGALRSAFAPEPLMVSAMALNELCMFPESIRMIRAFVQGYQDSYDWLKKNPHPADGYALTLAALKRPEDFPRRLASEWIRRPGFLSRQIALNALFSHPGRISAIRKESEQELARMSSDAKKEMKSLIAEAKRAIASRRNSDPLPEKLSLRYQDLRKGLARMGRFQEALRAWSSLADRYESGLPALRKDLVALVNRDFTLQNRRLLSSLEAVRANVDLIEVEIYRGASRDLVWKSVHPEFEGVKDRLADQKPGPSHRDTWSWGRIAPGEIESTEVWEDELGAIKADVHSLCDAKEKYIKLGSDQSQGGNR